MTDRGAKLKVQMLGDFRMLWGEEEVVLKSGPTTKALQILQLLLYHAPERVPTASVISRIFAYADVLNPNNNLKASISLLRRQLDESCLPDCSYVSFKNGGYIWCSELPPEVDVHLFEAAAKAAKGESDGEEQIRLCKAACELYTGGFLPGLRGVDWVETLNVYYAGLYADMMRTLSSLLFARDRSEELLPLAERAFQLLHTDEWQLMQMQCLMNLGRWDEAKRVYMDAVSTMVRDFDILPGADLVQQYRLISSQLDNALGNLPEMLDDVREDSAERGGYLCAFPGFIDSCRVIMRSMRRSGLSCYLGLCSLTGTGGEAIQNEKRLDEASEKLLEAIQGSLRQSDFFTQYNKSQFLFFLQGTCLENCQLVQQRIDDRFHSYALRGVRVTYQFHTALLETMDRLNSSKPLNWD